MKAIVAEIVTCSATHRQKTGSPYNFRKKTTPTTKCCGEMLVSEELITARDLCQLLLITSEE